MTNQVASGPRHTSAAAAPAGESRTTESRSRTPTMRHGIALTIILTCQMMLVLDATVMNVALPRIQSALHFSPTDLSWVMSAYTLSFGGLLLLGGRAGDILGRRRMFVAGITLFTVASLAGGLAPTSGALIAARIAQGVGAAMAGPSTIALITTTFTEARARVRALALLSAMASSGFAIGLIVGGLLTQYASWRWVMFINVPFGAAAVLLAPRFVVEPPRHPARLDLAGAFTGTAGVGALVFGLIHAAENGWSTATTVISIAAGAVLLGVFLAVQARREHPLLPLRLFADRNRAAGYANFFLGPAAMMSMFFFLTQYLQDVSGFDALATGLAFMPMAVAMFSTTRIVPMLLHRVGPRPLALTGTSIMVVGLVWLTQLGTTTGYATGLLAPMVLMGFGGGLAFVPLSPVIFASVPPQDAGAAGGVLQTMQQTGSTLGLAVLVTVYGAALHAAGPVSHSAALVYAMDRAFAVAAGIAGLTVLIALTFRKTAAPASAPATAPAPATASASSADA
jgi:EmrB/QacA subfamily drug resistance transporter